MAANVSTTLSAAITARDNRITVASTTGIAAGDLMVFSNGELAQVTKGYTAGDNPVPVRRGVNGSPATAHVAGSVITHNVPQDLFGDYAPGASSPFPPAGTPVARDEYVAAGAITLPQAGEHREAVLIGTDALAMTIADPDEAISGARLTVSASGAAAHTLTFASGLSGASTSYDVVTMNGTGPISLDFVARNGYWHSLVQVPMAGTVTNITGTVA